jgi:hypothetical protein
MIPALSFFGYRPLQRLISLAIGLVSAQSRQYPVSPALGLY